MGKEQSSVPICTEVTGPFRRRVRVCVGGGWGSGEELQGSDGSKGD